MKSHKNRKSKLRTLLSSVLALSLAFTSLPAGMVGSGEVAAASSTIEANYAPMATYTSEVGTIHDYNDPDNTKLTDGVYAGDTYCDKLFGFTPRSITTGYITFDFGEEIDLTRVVLSGFEKNSFAIVPCPEISFEYFDEEKGKWVSALAWTNSPHFTGDDKDGPGRGFGNYRDEHEVNVTASQVRFAFKGMGGGWLFYDEIELYGPVDESIPTVPVLEKDLGQETSVAVGGTTTLSVAMKPPVDESIPTVPVLEKDLGQETSVAVGGTTTLSVAMKPMEYGEGVITYDWYKDGQKIEGANSPDLVISDATEEDAGAYHVVVTNTKGELFETVTSRTCSLVVVESSDNNLLQGIPFTTAMTYGDANLGKGNYIERDIGTPAENILTDSLKSGGDIGNIRTGYYNRNMGNLSYADFTFDLGEAKQFEQLNLSTLGGASGIGKPSRFQVFISNSTGSEIKWKLIHDVETPADAPNVYEYIYKSNGAKVTARYVKIHVYFNTKENWVGLDEIELLGEADGREADGVFSSGGYIPPEKGNMLSFGKPYTTNKQSADDPDLTALTDGVVGDDLGNKWINYPASSGNLEVVLDLEEPTVFEQVDVNLINYLEGEARWPEWVKLEYSNDKSSWKLLEQRNLGTPSSEDTEVARIQVVPAQPVSARYVRLTVPNSESIAVDELIVLKLKTAIVSPEDPDVTVDPNNLAYGRPYTSAWPAKSTYPDDNNELTNGKRARLAYNDPEWTGFHMQDGAALGLDDFYITVDLGSVQSFEQVKVGNLREKSPGISAMTGAKVEYSSDAQKWTVLSDDEADFEADGVHRYIATAEEPVSGRYVRIHLRASAWLFLDEIEVLATADSNPDANENPDYGQELNLLRGNKGYTISQKPAMNNLPGLLTDGKYGVTYTKYDTNWMGFKQPGHVTMNFDLMTQASVSDIIVSTRQDKAHQITIPQNLKIDVSYNGQDWLQLKTFDNTLPTEGTNLSMTCDISEQSFTNSLGDAAEAVYVRYIRIEFDVPAGGNYVYLDEVKAMGKFGKCSDAGIPYVLAEDGTRNLAEGAPYTFFPEGRENTYSDASMTKLTDGIKGSGSFTDGKWVGLNKSDPLSVDPNDARRSQQPFRTVVLDLGSEKSIKSISFNNLVSAGAGVGASHWMNLFVSSDGENWTQLTQTHLAGRSVADGVYTYGWHIDNMSTNGIEVEDLMPNADTIAAQYVRLDVFVPAWLFLDEITVRGYDQVQPDAVYPTGTDEIGGTYQTQEDSGGVGDMILCYNGWYGYDEEGGTAIGDKTPFKYRPLLTYIDRNNKAVDTMFDTVLLLALGTRGGRNFQSPVNGGVNAVDWNWYMDKTFRNNKAVDTMFDTVLLLALGTRGGRNFQSPVNGGVNAVDWNWYMDKTFNPGGDVDALNQAAQQASQELNDPNYKVKLIVMFPGFEAVSSKFGSLDGKRDLDLSKEEDREYALDWWLDEAIERFESADYQYIDFWGFYWLSEGAYDAKSEQHIMSFNDEVHSRGYKTYWIPYWVSAGYNKWKDLGFDGATMQPNHFFNSPYTEQAMSQPVKYGNPLMGAHSKIIKFFNLGPEFEVDGEAATKPIKYNVWLDYLNSAAEYGYDGPGKHRDWYYDMPLVNAAYSGNDTIRTIYEYAYQVMKGTYTPKEYIDADKFPLDPDWGGLFRNDEDPGDSSTGGGSSGGGGSTGGGGGTTDPGKPGEPETPPTGDENYTWEETDDGYQLTDKDGEIVTGWANPGDSSTGGGSSGGGGSTGGGGGTTDPGKPGEPETPPTGDENYTWEETDDGYQLTDKDGEIVTGWAKVDGKWYYLNDNGIRQTGWQKVDNKWYYLKADGVMATGWLKLGNVWYFLNGGVMQTGWLYNGGAWYYLYDWGGMANSGWVQVGNTWYYFRGNGAMMTGWLQQGSTWYYLKDSGAMATGWNWIGSKCYYFYGSGKMAANTTVGGYKLDASGAWVK